jgi:hypothetical protein
LISKQAYFSFVKDNPHLPLFAQPFWLDVVAPAWQIWHITIENQPYFLPFLIEKKGPFTFVRHLALTPYTSIYTNANRISESNKQLLQKSFYKHFSAYSLVELDQHYLLPSIAQDADMNKKNLHTNIIDTTKSIEEIKKNFKTTLQRHLKFAEKNLRISQCTDAVVIYDLLISTASFRHLPSSHSLALLQNILGLSAEKKCGIAWQVTDQNNVVQAALLQVWDAQASYAILAASLYPQPIRGAMPSLLWHAILHTKKLDIPIFDFEGSRVKSIDTFFKTFGTEQKNIVQINMQNSKIAKLLLAVKNKIAK